MDDVSVLIIVSLLVVGMVAVVGILLRKVGHLQSAVVDMDTRVKTVTAPALSSMVETVNHTNTEVSTFRPSVQTLGTVATNLQQIVTTFQKDLANMTEYGRRYEEVEKEVRSIHSVLIGSYRKGRAGEETLALTMEPLIKMGRVRTKVPLGRGVVEYAVTLDDGKVLPIDSKIVATEEVASFHDEKTSPQDRAQREKEIKKRVKDKISEVQKYIDTDKTSPLAVLALPDSVMDIVTDLMPEAVGKNIILLGYSGIPQLIPYFVRIYGMYGVAKDAEKMQQCVLKVHQDLSDLNEDFFFNRFKKPLGTIGQAVETAERVVSGISTLTSEAVSKRPQLVESTGPNRVDGPAAPVQKPLSSSQT